MWFGKRKVETPPAETLQFDRGDLLVNGDIIQSGPVPHSRTESYRRRLDVDGAQIFIAESLDGSVSVLAGNHGEALTFFASPESRTSEPLKNNKLVKGLQGGDEIKLKGTGSDAETTLRFVPRKKS